MSETAASENAVPVKAWSAPELARRPPTVGELDELVRQAHEDAYARGHDEGFQHGLKQAQGVVERMLGVVENLRRPLEQLDGEVVDVLMQLAGTIASGVLRDAYTREPERLAALAGEIVAELAPQPRAVELRLHPDDAAAIAPLIGGNLGGGAARVIADGQLRRGDLRVHADAVRFDATVATRVEARVAALLAGANA